MSTSSRFAMGVHVLAALSLHEGQPVASGKLAQSVNTNPAFLRQVMGRLREAGFLRTRPGPGGGAVLTRSAEDISLYDVFATMETLPLIATHCCAPTSDCTVATAMPKILAAVTGRVEQVIEQELRRTSIQDIATEVRTGCCPEQQDDNAA